MTTRKAWTHYSWLTLPQVVIIRLIYFGCNGRGAALDPPLHGRASRTWTAHKLREVLGDSSLSAWGWYLIFCDPPSAPSTLQIPTKHYIPVAHNLFGKATLPADLSLICMRFKRKKRFKITLLYYRDKTQYANFRGNPLYQAKKKKTTVEPFICLDLVSER